MKNAWNKQSLAQQEEQHPMSLYLYLTMAVAWQTDVQWKADEQHAIFQAHPIASFSSRKVATMGACK